MTQQITLWTLHGFLGNKCDFNFLHHEAINVKIQPLDWSLFSWDSLEDLGSAVNDKVRNHPSLDREMHVLMGYSLGGRIALHAIKQESSLYKGAIFLSTHPGLTENSEKSIRAQSDKKRAEDFLSLPWSSLMEQWNSQLLFKGEESIFDRKEEDYNRAHLAKILTQGSLATQGDFRPWISKTSLPILWLCGGKDDRFCQVAQSISLIHNDSKLLTIKDGGHRFPWTRQSHFLSVLSSFLQNLSTFQNSLYSIK